MGLLPDGRHGHMDDNIPLNPVVVGNRREYTEHVLLKIAEKFSDGIVRTGGGRGIKMFNYRLFFDVKRGRGV